MNDSFDWTRALLSCLIASISAFVAFEAVGHREQSEKRQLWITLGSLTLGVGIWSTHFHSLLGWHAGFRRFYDTRIIFGSVLLAVLGSWLALNLISRPSPGSRVNRAIASLFLAGGITGMHMAGMIALHFAPEAQWSIPWLTASFCIAVLLSYGSLSLLSSRNYDGARMASRGLGATTLGVGICLAHFTAMHAMMLPKGIRSIQTLTNMSGPVLGRIGTINVFVFAFGLLILSYHRSSRWMQLAHEARVQAEDASRQAERLATAGKIAASIAHEINNPLEAVINLLYLMKDEKNEACRQEYLGQAQSEVNRISEITTHTLKFYRQQSAPELVDVTDLLETAIVLFQAKMDRAQIHVERFWEPDLPLVLCRAGEIRQVLANLVGNATDAMPTGGILRLVLRKREDTLEISVADTGCGISEETKQRIFEPFFTTKGAAGTGLGLSISAEIIARHGGQIELMSSTKPEDRGTQFRICLPCHPEQPTPTFSEASRERTGVLKTALMTG
ncbi:histidine kinase [Granulicella sibirica]|uniref:histidine kinase n=2 Tax=Granulicella sibirica TaxID=2479048 RepID=A0A4Q0T3J1_9BACT|nr:histidine kinase [Granulicella sibirica]